MSSSPSAAAGVAVAFVGLSLLAPATAGAATSAGVSLETANAATRLVATVKSTKPFTARTRPRAVTIVAGKKKYALRKRSSKRTRSVWSTKAATGSAGARLAKLAGSKVKIKVRSRAGTRTYRKRVKAPAATTPTPAPAPQGPTATPQARFLSMFNNSGWDRPVITTGGTGEDLYNFCADNRFFNRFTSPLSGTDYQYNGSWQLLGVTTGIVQGYNVVEGHVTASSSDQYGTPKQFELFVDLSEQKPNTAYINQQEHSRVTAQAC